MSCAERTIRLSEATGTVLMDFQPGKPVQLPPPNIQGGKPLMEALSARRSVREYSPAQTILPRVLSDLLWAAFGVNRPESDGRTAPLLAPCDG